MVWKLSRSVCYMFLSEFMLICARSRWLSSLYSSNRVAGMKCAVTMNNVETKELCSVRYSSTSNKSLLFCGFEVFRDSRSSYLNRLWSMVNAYRHNKCCSMFKFGVMYCQIWTLFLWQIWQSPYQQVWRQQKFYSWRNSHHPRQAHHGYCYKLESQFL
jgi:hypothetical protein